VFCLIVNVMFSVHSFVLHKRGSMSGHQSATQFQDNQNKTAIQDCVGHCVNAAVTIRNPMPDGQQKRNIVVFSHRGGLLLHNHYLMLCFNHLETLKARLGSSKTHLWSLRTEGGF